MVLGTVVAACRISPIGPLRLAGTVWVETVRNTPLAVHFLIFYFGFTKIGIRYSEFTSGILVLTVYTSAFVAETVRAGVNTVAQGQGDAARAVGLTLPQTLWSVVLPQAFRTVVAPIGNLFIALTKNSSVAAVIAVSELTKVAEDLSTDTAQPIPVFIGAGMAYLLLTLPSGFLFEAIERRVAFKR
jgi:glutamate transport system permease protein